MTPEKVFEARVANNPYPGRGLVVGKDSDGEWTLVYWIMGRSSNSRNRKFVADGGTLRTEAVDPAKLEDPSLIIYEAMLERPGVQLVSNGDQTRTLFDALGHGETFTDALMRRAHEPDAPNYTPRISAMLDFRGSQPSLTMGLLVSNQHDPAETDRSFFSLAAPASGLGRALTTYLGDGSPLPSFRENPMTLPLPGDTAAIADWYWQNLDSENRVALAVKRVDESGALRQLVVRNAYA